MPTGWTCSRTRPTKWLLLKPSEMALARLNTAILVVFCMVTKAKLLSGVTCTPIALLPLLLRLGAFMVPRTIGPAPDSALAALMTTAPWPFADSRYWPLLVMARPLLAPGTETVRTMLGACPDRFRHTSIPSLTDTNEYWPFVLSRTANGEGPVWTLSLLRSMVFVLGADLAQLVLVNAPPAWPPPLVPPWWPTRKNALPPMITISAQITAIGTGERYHGARRRPPGAGPDPPAPPWPPPPEPP